MSDLLNGPCDEPDGNVELIIQRGLVAAFGQLTIASLNVDFKSVVTESKDACDWPAKSKNLEIRKETRERVLDAIKPLHEAGQQEVIDHLDRMLPEV